MKMLRQVTLGLGALALCVLAGCGGGNIADRPTAGVTDNAPPQAQQSVKHKAAATMAAASAQTIFTDQTPQLPDFGEPVSYELGLRFQAKVDGRITAIRYWKAPSETPSSCTSCSVTHTGKIWRGDDSNATTITFASFVNETASGWQEAKLAQPLFIQKGVTYIVSVEANSHYVATLDGLSAEIGNSHLVALEGGGVYGTRGQRPTQVYRNMNYFRDVVFEPIDGQTIFANQTPQLPDATDGVATCVGCQGKAYELGTRFTAAVDGQIVGVRYWRAPSETLRQSESTANNVGRIWSENGQVLATVGFDFQWPRSGWHYAYLATPLDVQAGKTYTVSVYTNSHFAMTPYGLSTSVSNGNLTALANGGVNGDPATFPTNSWGANYFRDVLFKPATGLGVTTGGLPTAKVGQSYNESLSASGGVRPYTWRLASGSLPVGIALAADGTLSGTPTQAGSASLTFEVTDAGGNKASTGALTLEVLSSMQITTPSNLPEGRIGQNYSAKLEAKGGNGTFWWSIVSGNLLSGLSLTLDGQIIGTPRSAGTTTVRLGVQDNAGGSSEADFTLTVVP
jgi:hypothetical protein